MSQQEQALMCRVEYSLNKDNFPIPNDHPSIPEFERLRPLLLEALKPCGAMSLSFILRGYSKETAEPTIHIGCQYPDKFVPVSTHLAYFVSDGYPQRY